MHSTCESHTGNSRDELQAAPRRLLVKASVELINSKVMCKTGLLVGFFSLIFKAVFQKREAGLIVNGAFSIF